MLVTQLAALARCFQVVGSPGLLHASEAETAAAVEQLSWQTECELWLLSNHYAVPCPQRPKSQPWGAL